MTTPPLVTSTAIFGLGTGLLAWCMLAGIILAGVRRLVGSWVELGHITAENTIAVRDLTSEMSSTTNVLADHERRLTTLEDKEHLR